MDYTETLSTYETSKSANRNDPHDENFKVEEECTPASSGVAIQVA